MVSSIKKYNGMGDLLKDSYESKNITPPTQTINIEEVEIQEITPPSAEHTARTNEATARAEMARAQQQQTISNRQAELTGRGNEATARAEMARTQQQQTISNRQAEHTARANEATARAEKAREQQEQIISNHQAEHTARANEATARAEMAREQQEQIISNHQAEHTARANEATARAEMARTQQQQTITNRQAELTGRGNEATARAQMARAQQQINQQQENPIQNKEIDNYTYNYNRTISYNNKTEGALNQDATLKGYISQGMTIAGDYKVYGFIKKSGDETVASAIRITDKNGNVIKTFTTNDTSLIGHANDLEFDSKTGNVYIATMNKNAPLKSFNLNEAINSKDSKIAIKNETEMFNNSELKNLSGFTIDKKTGNMYFASGKTIKVVKDGKVIQTIKKQSGDNSDNSHEAQGIFAKDGKLFVIRYNRNSSHSNGGNDVKADSATASANMIDVYENGEYSKTISVEAPTYINEKGQQVIGEMESISFDENTGKYNANFYYKTISNDDNSRAYCTTNLDVEQPTQLASN